MSAEADDISFSGFQMTGQLVTCQLETNDPLALQHLQLGRRRFTDKVLID
jgi:hypothetical protein